MEHNTHPQSSPAQKRETVEKFYVSLLWNFMTLHNKNNNREIYIKMNEKKGTLWERRKKHLSYFFIQNVRRAFIFHQLVERTMTLLWEPFHLSPVYKKACVCSPGSRRQIFKINFFHENSFSLVYNNKCCTVAESCVLVTKGEKSRIHIILFFR